jgi:hypothetical protein
MTVSYTTQDFSVIHNSIVRNADTMTMYHHGKTTSETRGRRRIVT